MKLPDDFRKNELEAAVLLFSSLWQALGDHSDCLEKRFRDAKEWRNFRAGTTIAMNAMNRMLKNREVVPQKTYDKMSRITRCYEVFVRPKSVSGCMEHLCRPVCNEDIRNAVQAILESGKCAFCLEDGYRKCNTYKTLLHLAPPLRTGTPTCPYAGIKADDIITDKVAEPDEQ